MQNSRTIFISVGSSRKSTSWHTQSITLEDFYAKLALVNRTSELLETYFSLPKSQQDGLKDVGGFVGGQMDGNRLVHNLKGRDIVTLDLDHCPPGSSDEIETKMNALGCGYCIYSTRKHRPSAPRLRVVVPVNRTMSVEEYEPIARKLAEMILQSMDWFDPTTFEVTRLMYWPSASADSEVFYRKSDAPLLSADGILGMYKDWTDISEWPVVPGVSAKRRKAAQAEDPTEKKGIIGTFCRAYTISAAIDKFLPDTYVDAGEDRYTFLGGSTAGGAVVYDDRWLYSHHATDPCSGRLVNAFDLVRLHKFGEQDAESAPGCPVGKLPSYLAMKDFLQADADIQQLQTDERAGEILAAFESSMTAIDANTAPAKKLADCLGGLNGGTLDSDMLRKTLDAAGISIWYDEINRDFRAAGVASYGFTEDIAAEQLPTMLEDWYRKANVRGAGRDSVLTRIAFLSKQNRKNPVRDMLVNNLWDGADRISILLDEIMCLPSEDATSRMLVRKWLLQCIALACNDSVRPWGADGILALLGAQGIGKTSLVRRLAVLPEWFRGGAALSFRDKDTQISATNVWICELGEMERTVREDESAMKAFITAEFDSIRLPYARTAIKQPRRTSFCGTLNSDRYLRDDTGNRRFWTVPLDRIDLDLLFRLSDDWFTQLWLQSYEKWVSAGDVHCYRLNGAERALLEPRNAERMQELPGEEELLEILDPELPADDWSFVSGTQLVRMTGAHMDARRMGRVATRIIDSGRFPGAEKRRTESKRGFWLPISKDISIT